MPLNEHLNANYSIHFTGSRRNETVMVSASTVIASLRKRIEIELVSGMQFLSLIEAKRFTSLSAVKTYLT